MPRYAILPDRSTVVVEAHSTLGPILFEAVGTQGEVEATVEDGVIVADAPVRGRLEVDLRRLVSGNSLYDAELARRIDVHHFPTVVVELTEHAPVDRTRHFVRGTLTFHGDTHELDGTVQVEARGPADLQVVGEQSIDIRRFGIPQPSMLMLRIFPDVIVRLFVAAALDD